jgi:hypothetical protein
VDDHLVFDGANPVAENNARRDDRRHGREDAETLRRLMGHGHGRAFMYRLLNRCHIHNTPVVPGDPYTSAFNFGREDVGKQLVKELMRACPELYVKMLSEAVAEEDRVAAVRAEENRKRSDESEAAMMMQGFDLPKPPHLEEKQDGK